MSSKATINGNEYSYGEIVESEFFDDKSKEIVLNGEVVKVGDVWLTRELKEVVITNINVGMWPIRDNKERTYSVYGIADSCFKVSDQDLMSKLTDVEDVKYTKHMKDTEDVEEPEDAEEFGIKPTNDVKDLPILDIQIGDVWETSEGKKVEIAHHNPTQDLEWISTEGVSYTNKGTYFSSMRSPNKDLVLRISRNTEIKEAVETNEATEVKGTYSSDTPSSIPDKYSHYADALRSSTISVKDDAIDALRYLTIENVCSKDTTINFENAVKMHMDSIVSLIGDRICEKVKSRDISSVMYLTRVLEKVIALESL